MRSLRLRLCTATVPPLQLNGRPSKAAESDVSEADQDEFEKAFAESANARTAGQADTNAPAAAGADVVPASPTAAQEQKPTTDPTPEAAPSPPTLEELQKQLADAQHRERSSANRISAFARQNHELQSAIAELSQTVKALQAGAQRQTAAAPAAPAEDDVLTAAPDLEAAVQKRLKSHIEPLMKRLDETQASVETVGKATAEVRQAFEPMSREAERNQIAATHAALDQAFTTKWREDLKSERFGEWLDAQPQAVQHQFQTAISVEDSAAVLARFYVKYGMPTPTPVAAPAASTQTPQQRLRQAAGVAPRGAPALPPAAPADDDYEAHFELARKRRLQQA